MADTIRGNGFARLRAAMEGLINDNELDRARAHFDESPPSYASRQSHNSTRSQSPTIPNDAQRLHEERQLQLRLENAASLPNKQFGDQVDEERERIIKADVDGTHVVPAGTNFYQLASDNVRSSWTEQGIWNNNWNKMALGRWKHEEPLQLSSASDTNSETNLEIKPQPNLFTPNLFTVSSETELKPRGPANSVELQANSELHREASRPFHQFIHQISKERERIQDRLRAATSIPPDINTKAYENIKNIWIKRGIWNARWGTLPGMSWKHERPEEVFDDENTCVQANPSEDENCSEDTTNIFDRYTSPGHNQAFDAIAGQQGSRFIHPSASENGTTRHSSLIPNQFSPAEMIQRLGRGTAKTSFSPAPSKKKIPPRAAVTLPPRRSERLQSRNKILPKKQSRAERRGLISGTAKLENSVKPQGASKRRRPKASRRESKVS